VLKNLRTAIAGGLDAILRNIEAMKPAGDGRPQSDHDHSGQVIAADHTNPNKENQSSERDAEFLKTYRFKQQGLRPRVHSTPTMRAVAALSSRNLNNVILRLANGSYEMFSKVK
jgi:hypothetical protein